MLSRGALSNKRVFMLHSDGLMNKLIIQIWIQIIAILFTQPLVPIKPPRGFIRTKCDKKL